MDNGWKFEENTVSMLFTNKQRNRWTEKQMDRRTNANDYITSVKGGGKYMWIAQSSSMHYIIHYMFVHIGWLLSPWGFVVSCSFLFCLDKAIIIILFPYHWSYLVWFDRSCCTGPNQMLLPPRSKEVMSSTFVHLFVSLFLCLWTA